MYCLLYALLIITNIPTADLEEPLHHSWRHEIILQTTYKQRRNSNPQYKVL